MSVMTEIAQYIHSLRYEDLPAPVVAAAKTVIKDTIGCGIGGAATVPGRLVIDLTRDLGGATDAQVIGTKLRTNLPQAAYANAFLMDILDYEDCLVVHPSVGVIPGALAAAELAGASGRDLITAVVAGYEVACRIGRAIAPSPQRNKEIAALYTWMGFGAAVAAAKLLRLTPDQIAHALAYTGCCSPLPVWITKWERPLHWVKNNFAEQARAGVLGVLAAQRGFQSPTRIFESDLGFYRMAGSDQYDPTALTRGLGLDYEILKTGYKPYPACRWCHPALDALGLIKQRVTIRPDEVRAVRVRSFSDMTDWFADYRPAGLVDAEFSTPYVLAIALLDIPPGPDWYTPERLTSPEVLALADRVQLIADDEANEAFARIRRFMSTVEVEMTDGTVYREKVDVPRGDPGNPLTPDEMNGKFLQMAEPALGQQTAHALVSAFDHLEQEADLHRLFAQLAPVQ